jgi:hypothetical protein
MLYFTIFPHWYVNQFHFAFFILLRSHRIHDSKPWICPEKRIAAARDLGTVRIAGVMRLFFGMDFVSLLPLQRLLESGQRKSV